MTACCVPVPKGCFGEAALREAAAAGGGALAALAALVTHLGRLKSERELASAAVVRSYEVMCRGITRNERF
jgi:hypothetical protein